MSFIEILVIVLATLFVVIIFSLEIYKRIKRKPTDACEECHYHMKMAVKRMRKEMAKKKKLENK